MFIDSLVARLLQCLPSLDVVEQILLGILVVSGLGYVFIKIAELYGEDTS